MITFSGGQMQALGASARVTFEELMVRHMGVRSTEGLEPPALRERTLRLIALAEQHGIVDYEDIRRLLEQVFDRIPAFVQSAEVRAILQSPTLPPSGKVAFIADALQPAQGS